MSVQLEDGYTRIANELLECLMKTKLNGTQYSIINCIIRYTYGFQRKSHAMSLTFISTAIEAHKDSVKRELDKLIECNLVEVFKAGDYTSSREIGMNKNVIEWDIHSKSNGRQSANQSTLDESANLQSPNKSTPTVDGLAHQERKSFKENLKETYLSQFEEFWKLYPSKKGKGKAQIKWLLLSPKMDFEKVIEGTKAYIAFIEHGKANGRNREYKDGATFVNQESWNDEWTIQNVNTFKPTNKQQPNLQIVQPTDQERKELRDAFNKQLERNGVSPAVNI